MKHTVPLSCILLLVAAIGWSRQEPAATSQPVASSPAAAQSPAAQAAVPGGPAPIANAEASDDSVVACAGPSEVSGVAPTVLFDFGKATLQPKAEEELTISAALAREWATGTVSIEGHTDSKGDDAYNQKLSQRRAESVRRWLVRNGLGRLQFSVSGLGETNPLVSNTKPDGTDDPEGRQKNRRVHIVILKGADDLRSERP